MTTGGQEDRVLSYRAHIHCSTARSGSQRSNLIQVRQIPLYPVLHVGKLEIREYRYRYANLSNRALVQTRCFSSPVG